MQKAKLIDTKFGWWQEGFCKLMALILMKRMHMQPSCVNQNNACAWNNTRFRDPPNGCKVCIFEWRIILRNLYDATRRVKSFRNQVGFNVQVEKIHLWIEVVANNLEYNNQ